MSMQALRVGQYAKVVALNRPTTEDRSERVGQAGLVIRRLNVPWEPDVGQLWELRFDDRKSIVFSDSELAVVRNGVDEPVDIEDMKERWGKAPRTPSLPFRRFGSGVGAAPAMLALLIFAIAGSLLVWAGVASDNWMLGAAGAAVVLIGVVGAGVLIS